MSLQIQNLKKSFGARTLFSNVTFSINRGEKVALVGNNGSGKTTLMKIILGSQNADEGKIIVPKDARIGYMPQEIFLENLEGLNSSSSLELTLWELASQAFTKLRDIEKQIEALHKKIRAEEFSPALCEKLDQLNQKYEQQGGFTWQAKTTRILKGLGFSESRFNEPIKWFSGGWQMRAYFARLLLSEPDYLLLDEPTNYLDIASINFLENFLSSYPGGILMVSHDRYFLDALATSVVAIMPEGVRVFRGNYSEFLLTREYLAQEAEAAQKRQAKEIRRIERFIERFRYKASKASQVQSRIKALEKIERVSTIQDSKNLDFTFPPCQDSGEIVLSAEKISKSFGNKKVLNEISFSLYKGDKLAIIGENGVGKTTLMRILTGQDHNFDGTLKWGYRVIPAYFAQDEEISFEKDETVWERMLRETPLDKVPQLRTILGMFLFTPDMLDIPVRALSGGEKSRLGLARLLLRPCNLLLLDEPTNHLDISSREALLDALDQFNGTLVFVSHDRYFLDSLATRIIALDNGKAIFYEGDYTQYLWAKEKRLNEYINKTLTESPQKEVSFKQQSWKERKKQNNQRQKIEREIAQVEKLLSDLEEQIKKVQIQLENPNNLANNDEIKKISIEYARLKEQEAEIFGRWEQLQNQLAKTN